MSTGESCDFQMTKALMRHIFELRRKWCSSKHGQRASNSAWSSTKWTDSSLNFSSHPQKLIITSSKSWSK